MNKHRFLNSFKWRIFGRFPQFSYSRSGEDLILEEILGIQVPNRFYVDVGAFDPICYSNTYKFYLKGWTGINIDANREVISRFNKVRGKDININVGVGTKGGETAYYVFNEDESMNTISSIFLEDATKSGNVTIKETRSVKIMSLAKILEEYLPAKQQVDFFSIDVEGADLDVLNSNNWDKFRPRAIVIETNDCLSSLSENPIISFLKQQNYSPVAFSPVTLNAGNIYFLNNDK